ncbi:MAG: inositol monophosphatase [candidate division Zixibacteria bacterium]|nr:inositol monophosphatase [candidate division Zixibacteria bacterium]
MRREASKLVSFARDLAIDAGRVLKQGFHRRLTIQYKGRIDPVTDIDFKSERLITGSIAKHFPRHAILTEEGTNSKGTSGVRWIIDPLDGTVNFAHGFPIYCVSIGFEIDGQLAGGAIFDPERDELFWGYLGGGAYLNKTRISVSKETRLERALLATGFAYDIGTARRNNLGLFARVAKKVQGVRRPGSAAIDLCWLAAGRLDAFWELKLHPWDTAAAKIVVEEAGGRTSRVEGAAHSIFAADLLATNRLLHRKMVALLSGRR